jgi:hypothetical protein
MTRADWIAAFVTELERLRPHLRPQFGGSKILLAIANREYSPDTDPVEAARRYHERAG